MYPGTVATVVYPEPGTRVYSNKSKFVVVGDDGEDARCGCFTYIHIYIHVKKGKVWLWLFYMTIDDTVL